MGATLAFFVALFTEMYGFPLTIYILTAVLGNKYPVLNPFSHANGHVWAALLGGGTVTLIIVHIISDGLVFAGSYLMWRGWKMIHKAQGGLVTDGPYAHVRHPQYAGLILVLIGMLIQWPTIITTLMFPVLVYVYYRLSRAEEKDALNAFGDEYAHYMQRTTMFIPDMRRLRRSHAVAVHAGRKEETHA